MRYLAIPAVSLSLLFGIACAQENSEATKEEKPAAEAPATDDAATKEDPKVILEKSSYALGMNIGRSLKQQGIELDIAMFVEGMKTAAEGGKPKWTPAELAAAMEAFEKMVVAKASEKQNAAAAKNLQEGKDFLAANAKKEGVKTLPSGLQYEVVTAGSGASPKATDTVKTHYRGTLIDGTQFDSSYDRGEPATFPVGQVIKGWTEALQLMKVGDKWKLYIPSDLAYGERAPAEIGPNSVLIFDIELLGIDNKGEKEDGGDKETKDEGK